MDYERGWTNNPEFDELLQEFGIVQRFKTDKYAPNNLAEIDNKIGWIKNYLRQRLTEEGEDGDEWEKYFNEALDASNGRVHKQALFGKAPDELYDNQGEPQDEDAEVALYGIEKQQAERQFRNNERNKRQTEALESLGVFRVPDRLGGFRVPARLCASNTRCPFI